MYICIYAYMSVSPVYTALLGQARDWGRFSGCLCSGPTILSGCRGYSIDLSVVGIVFIEVRDLQLGTSHRHLIPRCCLVTATL